MTIYTPGGKVAAGVTWCSRRRQEQLALLVRTLAIMIRERDESAIASAITIDGRRFACSSCDHMPVLNPASFAARSIDQPRPTAPSDHLEVHVRAQEGLDRQDRRGHAHRADRRVHQPVKGDQSAR
jgi:hypothetical protein